MKRWALGAMLALLLPGCGERGTYHYKMTVEVETPQGLRTGSAVREFRWAKQPQILSGNDRVYGQRGEAVAVDLPNGKTLFALLDENEFRTVQAGFFNGQKVERAEISIALANADRAIYTYQPPATLRMHNLVWPRLVTFRDIADPTSVELLDPENLSAGFGSGYGLRRITMQVTDEPLKLGINNRLPWLQSVGKTRATLVPSARGVIEREGAAASVTPSDFSTELYK